jgi:hypothetical protein
MKRRIMWIWCWTLFWMGHATSRALVPMFPWFYLLYNKLMSKSCEVNDKYDFDVWSKDENKNL